jgi:hypothetical protein
VRVPEDLLLLEFMALATDQLQGRPRPVKVIATKMMVSCGVSSGTCFLLSGQSGRSTCKQCGNTSSDVYQGRATAESSDVKLTAAMLYVDIMLVPGENT